MKKIATRIYKIIRFWFGMSSLFSILGLLGTQMEMKGIYYGVSIGSMITVMYFFSKEEEE